VEEQLEEDIEYKRGEAAEVNIPPDYFCLDSIPVFVEP
jgi:hypothetical protein